MARGGRRYRVDHGGGGERPATAQGTGQDGAGAGGTGSVRGAARGPRRAPGAPAPLVRDVSAGGVVYRRQADGHEAEVALVGRLHPKRWALPKGTPEVGETLEGTAVREVAEETGLEVRIVQPLDQIQYWFLWGGVRHFKTVHFYLMHVVGGDTADHDGEYDVVEWFPIGEALRRLSYPNEARVVDKAQQVLGSGS